MEENRNSKSTPSPVKSVWGVPLQAHVESPSLNEVMSEQLAKDLIEKEEQSELKKIISELDDDEADFVLGAEAAEPEDETDCADDLLIAQMLQLQFDQVKTAFQNSTSYSNLFFIYNFIFIK